MNTQDKEGLDIEPVVMPLWPDAGRRLGLSRNGSYDAARRGEIPGLVRFGRLHRVVRAVFFRELGIPEENR